MRALPRIPLGAQAELVIEPVQGRPEYGRAGHRPVLAWLDLQEGHDLVCPVPDVGGDPNAGASFLVHGAIVSWKKARVNRDSR